MKLKVFARMHTHMQAIIKGEAEGKHGAAIWTTWARENFGFTTHAHTHTQMFMIFVQYIQRCTRIAIYILCAVLQCNLATLC